MTHDFVGWTPPPGAVVDPPVHPETTVDVFYSDRTEERDRAEAINWSSYGDGPCVVAYAVVQEYKPAPDVDLLVTEAQLNRWIIAMGDWDRGGEAAIAEMEEILDRREAPDPSREVVAWAVVRGDKFRDVTTFYSQSGADHWASERGGTVVKLTGVRP